MTLFSLGWNEFFANQFQPYRAGDLVPARVTLEHKHAYQLLSLHGELAAECTGKFLHEATTRADFPAVGDWVAVRVRPAERRADIHGVLRRRTKFSRRAAGDAPLEQIVAANVDAVLLVTALDQNFNLRRIERYLAVAWESGAQPIVVLNKADLHRDPAAAEREVKAISAGAPVVTLTALPAAAANAPDRVTNITKPALVEELLAPWLVPGRTLALLGSSGVGKSTLVNRLLGDDRQLTSTISDAVGKGRHTTARRELIIAPSGVLIIDTPGMRELQLWEVDAGALDATFADVAALATRCRFRDCSHRAEPGCAIHAALDDGSLGFERWESFKKLQREQAYAARKADPRLARAANADWRKIHRTLRAVQRMKEDG